MLPLKNNLKYEAAIKQLAHSTQPDIIATQDKNSQ